VPVLTALGGAAGILFLERYWNALLFVSAVLLLIGILYTAKSCQSADG
jgi:hypothetical protein